MRFAYADPPYPGKADLYREHPDYAGEVDHAELVERLSAEYPDGWALSTHAHSLKTILALCPPEVRVHAYIKEVPAAKGRRAGNAWEPVLFVGGRDRPTDAPGVRDWVRSRPLDHRTFRGGRGVIGMKPPEFCWWLFDCLGAQPRDTLDDLFPGSGAVAEAWERFRCAPTMRRARSRRDASSVATDDASGLDTFERLRAGGDPSPGPNGDFCPRRAALAKPLEQLAELGEAIDELEDTIERAQAA